MAAYVALIAAIFPSIEGSEELDELVEDYPDFLKSLFGIADGASLTSGPGFLDAELFSFMLPLFVLILAVGSGSRTFAGEEDSGRLELLLAYPLRRRDAVFAKAVPVALEVLALCAVAFAVLLAFDPLVGFGLSTGKLAAAAAGLATIGASHGWLALAVGAAVPSRAVAIAVPAAVAALGYLVNGLHDLAGWLEPFRFLSVFWLVGSNPLQEGVRWTGVAVVLAAGAAALVAGGVLVERRDLKTP